MSLRYDHTTLSNISDIIRRLSIADPYEPIRLNDITGYDGTHDLIHVFLEIKNSIRLNDKKIKFWVYSDQVEGFYYKVRIETSIGVLKIDSTNTSFESKDFLRAHQKDYREISIEELMLDWMQATRAGVRQAIINEEFQAHSYKYI